MKLFDIFSQVGQATLLLIHVIMALGAIACFALRTLRALSVALGFAAATVDTRDNGDLSPLRVGRPRGTAAGWGGGTGHVALSWTLASSRRSEVVNWQAHCISMGDGIFSSCYDMAN